MALSLELKLEETTKGILKSVKETSLLGYFPKTEYVFRDYNGKRRVLKMRTHVGSEKNEGRKGDMIVIHKSYDQYESSQEFLKIEVRRGLTSKLRYFYICPSSEVELS